MAAASAHLWSFFSPGESPPAFCAPPSDTALKDRILLLAKYAMQNGLPFIETVRSKQAGNPEYDFLTPGGAANPYYRWALWATGCGIPLDQPPQQGFIPPTPHGAAAQYMPQQQHMYPQQPYAQQSMQYQHPMYYQQPEYQQPGYQQPALQQKHQQPAKPTPPPIPPEVAGGFSQVLDALTGSKDSIKASQGWFMACAPYAAGMAYMMASKAAETKEFDKLLHLIYLANDILFKAFTHQQQQHKQEADGQDAVEGKGANAAAVSAAFAPALGVMLAAAQAAANSADNAAGVDKLQKMLAFWQEKGLYDASVISRLQGERAAADPPAAVLANYPPPPAAAAAAPATSPPPATATPPASGWGPVPSPTAAHPQQQQMPAAAASGWGPPPAAAVQPASYGAGLTAGSGWGPPVVQQLQANGQYPHTPWPAGGPWGGAAGYQPQPAAAYPGMPSNGMMPPGVPPAAPVPPSVPYPGAVPVSGGFGLPAGGPVAAPQLPVQAPVAEPEQEPVSSFNFPPGLIPQLVRDKSKYSEPYAPIEPKEIDKAGLPPPPEKDAYLKSRLDKFMLEMRDYKPGSSRADLEEQRAAARAQQGLEPDSDEELALGSSGSRMARRKALGLGPSGVEGRRRRRGAGGMADDGSYMGPGGGRGEKLGLGAHSQSNAGLDDVYSSYRQLRSNSYHDMIIRGAGLSNMAKGG